MAQIHSTKALSSLPVSGMCPGELYMVDGVAHVWDGTSWVSINPTTRTSSPRKVIQCSASEFKFTHVVTLDGFSRVLYKPVLDYCVEQFGEHGSGWSLVETIDNEGRFYFKSLEDQMLFYIRWAATSVLEREE